MTALGLDPSAPKISGKALEGFMSFSEEQNKPSKNDEINDFRRFSQEIEKARPLLFPQLTLCLEEGPCPHRSLLSPERCQSLCPLHPVQGCSGPHSPPYDDS